MLEPGLEAYAGQTLGDELQFAVLAAGMVHLDQGAVERQGRGVEVARVFLGAVHVEQGQGMVFGLGHQVQGLGPRLFVDDDRQHLGREERAVVNRDDVDLVRQVLARQGQAFARFVLLGVFRIGVFARVFGEFLLVAHGGTCAMGMGLRWGRLAVVSTVIFCDAVFRRCVQRRDRLAGFCGDTIPCGSELARDEVRTDTFEVTVRPLSRASSLPQGSCGVLKSVATKKATSSRASPLF
ncbi:hypothetical protein D3C81_1520370 [compost metagenome]